MTNYIQCLINKSVVNKPTPDEHKQTTHNLEPFNGTIDEFAAVIKAGHSFVAPMLVPDGKGKYVRRNENFSRAEILVLDIDNQASDNQARKEKRRLTEEEGYISLQSIVDDPVMNANCWMVYTTCSHTDEWNRFRIIFKLPELIRDFKEYDALIKAFATNYNADKVGAVQAFSGNTDAKVYKSGNTLSSEFINNVINYHKQQAKYERDYPAEQMNGQVTPELIANMLEFIPRQMDHNDWKRVMSGVAKAVDEETAIRLINDWSPADRPDIVENFVRNPFQQVGFGTLVYFAKQGGWIPPKDFFCPNENRILPFTDVGNRDRFLRKYGKLIKYVNKSKMYFIYNGKYFELDEKELYMSYAINVIQEIPNEANDIEVSNDAVDSEENIELARRKKTIPIDWSNITPLMKAQIKNELKDYSQKCQATSKLDNMMKLVTKGTEVSATFEELDQEPYLLNVNNGVMNFKTGMVEEHSPKRTLTKMIKVDYDKNATCPKWEAFLEKIFAGDKELIEFIQRAVGYSLSGYVSEQCLFFAYGTGKNGKSVFFNVMQLLLHDYSQRAPTDMLLSKMKDNIPNDIARLRGKRFVVASELPENRSFNESKIKDLTGGDRLIARFLHGEYFEFDPTHKLWIYGNHKPKIKGTDDGIWRRIHLIPFTVKISNEEQRPQEELMNEFETELEGILMWAIHGYYLWKHDKGLKVPEIVSNATLTYRISQDPTAGFIDDCCYETESRKPTNQKDIFKEYEKWCNENQEFNIGRTTLYSKLEEKGYVRIDIGNKNKGFIGIGLNIDAEKELYTR